MQALYKLWTSIPRLPFQIIKACTLLVGIPIILYRPQYVPLMVQINILEAACQDLVDKNRIHAILGVGFAMTTPILASNDKWLVMAWGITYMVWHIGFCHRIGFVGVKPVVQNATPFVLLCVAPRSVGALAWAIGRTVAILQHQCEGLAEHLAIDRKVPKDEEAETNEQ